MSRRWTAVLPLVAFAVLAGLLQRGLHNDPAEIPSPLIGKAAPAFSLPALSMAGAGAAAAAGASSPRVAPQDLRGKPWVLNVFASWCGGCRDEHALLMRASREPGVTIVGLDYKDDPALAAGWLAGAGDPYAEIAVDAEGRTGIDYGVYGVPETFVIDREGVVRLKLIGALTEAAWNDRVRPLLDSLR